MLFLGTGLSRGSSSLLKIRPSVSGERWRRRVPRIITEMAPVSSETTATTASDRSLIPRPARWRMPRSLLRFMLSDMGSIQAAATIFPRRTTTAPS